MEEKRVHPRVPYQLSFECKRFYDLNGAVKQFTSAVVFNTDNLSAGGLQVCSDCDVPQDSVLSFTLYLESIPYIIMCRIRWKRPQGEAWCYGLEFLSIPNMLYNHLKQVVTHAAVQ